MQKVSIRPHIATHRSVRPTETTNHPLRYGLDLLIVLVMGFLLYQGLFGQTFSDVPVYQCYAVAFWKGLSALKTLSESQCYYVAHPQDSSISTTTLVHWMQAHHFPIIISNFIANQTSNIPLHSLPREYPLPSIIPFTLPLLVPYYWYQVAFAISMSVVAAIIYGLLRCFRSTWAAVTCALYLVIGGWATANGRFDLVPSAFTLGAIIFGVRKHWNWAFAFLAIAVTFKFYALPLLFPFLLAQQLTSEERWKSWRRFAPLFVFAAICLVVAAVSLSLSVEGTLAPLSYYGNRPFQVESAAASLLWLFHFLGYSLDPVYAYGSFSVTSPLASLVSLINAILLGTGLVYTWWLQWRNQFDLATSCLLTLLIVIFTGKVFSPQYLLWLIPLAAYVGERNPRWIAAWCLLGGLTTYIFPYLYMLYMGQFNSASDTPLFYVTIALRNLCFLCIIAWLLYSYSGSINGYRQPSSVKMRYKKEKRNKISKATKHY